MVMFRVPSEAQVPTLGELLRRALPELDNEARAKLLVEDRVQLDGRFCRDASRQGEAGQLVEVAYERDVRATGEVGLGEAPELARGEGWVIVDKPIGMPGSLDADDAMHPIFFMADMLGLDRATLRPCWTMPRDAGGPWLLAMDSDDLVRLRANLLEPKLHTVWLAIGPKPAMAQGRISEQGVTLDYAVIHQEGGLAEYQLRPTFRATEPGEPFDPVAQILDTMALAELTLLGDSARGGYMAEGGLRLRLGVLHDDAMSIGESWPAPGEDWWPNEDIIAVAQDLDEASEGGDEARTVMLRQQIHELRVSSTTLRIMDGGHPWALADRHTGSRDRLAPGTIVRLLDEKGRRGPWALVEGPDELAARLWSWTQEEADEFVDEVDMRVDEAFARRESLLRDSAQTDLFRLIHGEADGLPGLYLDRVGPLLRATIYGECAESFVDQVYRNVLDVDPSALLLSVAHLGDVRAREGRLPRARIVSAGSAFVKAGDRVLAHEDNLRYWCAPWEGIDVGFFADQRDNRRRLRREVEPGERWLNLFCHTGAFTVALMAEGAEVVSVDISKRYLAWLEDNLRANGFEGRSHRSIDADARKAIEELEGPFDGIIVDPPTAASGDEGFWSVRQDMEQLVAQCVRLLSPGGLMLVCINDRKHYGKLEGLVHAAAKGVDVELGAIEAAPPAADYPRLSGFPEGDTFEGLWVEGAARVDADG